MSTLEIALKLSTLLLISLVNYKYICIFADFSVASKVSYDSNEKFSQELIPL